MKHIYLLILTFFYTHTLYAQKSMYDVVNLGVYQVGITDTVIFDSNYTYEQHGYKGKKPYFVKIWHPLIGKQKNNYVTLRDFFHHKQNNLLNEVQDSLMNIYKRHFIRDYLSENLENGNENNFNPYSMDQVFELILKEKTRSISAPLSGKSNYPIIIYYNGSQGHPFENFLLAEYFASRGYIFIAASFELQFGNNSFGMLPYERFHSKEYEESLKTIVRFSKSLTSSANIYFIGHSMGAQMGLRTFGNDSTIKGMVSLETSIEFKYDLEKIKEMWPEVYQSVITEKVYYPFPILFCAATGQAKPFFFFENLRAAQVTYLSTVSEFEHNAYLSLFYLRYFIDNKIIQSDKYIIKNRLPLYVKHLDTIYNFINNSMNNPVQDKRESIIITK